MFRQITFLLIVYTMLFSFACLSKESSQIINDLSETELYHFKDLPPDIERIKKSGILRVAMYQIDTPPYYFVNEEGELDGVDVEIIKGFARLLGVDITFDRSAQSFNEVVNLIADRKADVAICKLSITFNRVSKVTFTRPYLKLHQSLLINRLLLAKQQKGRTREETIQSLEGKIGVIDGSSYVSYAKRLFRNMEVVGYDSWDETVNAVINGEVVAAFRDEGEIKKIIKDNPDSSVNLMSVVLLDAEDPKGIAVAWDAYNLKQLLEHYIDSLDIGLTATKALYEYDQVIESIHRKTH